MLSVINRPPPYSNLGPGSSGRGAPGTRTQVAGSIQAGSIAPVLWSNQARGVVRIIAAFCQDDQIDQSGRLANAWVPVPVLRDLVWRGANFGAPTPPSATAPISGGTAELVLQTNPGFHGGVLTDPDYMGLDFRFAGMIVSIISNLNAPPGLVTMNASGFFENGDPYTQHVVFNPGVIGVSRYYVLFTQENEGGAYPSLVRLQNDVLAAPPGTAITVTTNVEGGPTSITPTNGIRGGKYNLTLDFAGPDGVVCQALMLSPISSMWDWVFSEINYDVSVAGSGG